MALSANTDREYKDPGIKSFKVAASHIYKGSLVGVVKGTGYLVPVTDIADLEFVGVALEEKDNSAGSAGDLSCRVIMYGYHNIALSGIAVTDIGRYVYATDDNTVVVSGQSNNVEVGQIVDFPFSGIATVDISKRSKSVSQQSHIADPAALGALTGTAITDNSGGVDPGNDTIAVCTNQDTLTDNGAGTADDTVEDVADIALATGGGNTYSDAAVNTAVNTAIGSISNNFKEWTEQQVKQVAFNTAVTAAIAQLAAKNDLVVADGGTIETAVDILNACIDALHVALEKAEIVASA